MKAMLLAAGRGKRLRPLTDNLPKPLIRVGNETLLERHIKTLVQAGITNIVINVSYHREMIMSQLGDGSSYGACISWSNEGDEKLGTGGGIRNALPLLGEETFLVINSDIYTDWKPQNLRLADNRLARLILVDNPLHHKGDFCLERRQSIAGEITLNQGQQLTFSGIGYYQADLFSGDLDRYFELTRILRPAIRRNQVEGEYYGGTWADAGTPESLEKLRAQYG